MYFTSFCDLFCFKLLLQLVWRISAEILHHLPNSTVTDYNIIYERMKHSGVKHYLMVCIPASLSECGARCLILRAIFLIRLCFIRFAWNILSTWCSTGISKVQSSSSPSLRAGGTGRSQFLSSSALNWSRPTGACWIIWCGATKSPHSPKTVRRHLTSHY